MSSVSSEANGSKRDDWRKAEDGKTAVVVLKGDGLQQPAAADESEEGDGESAAKPKYQDFTGLDLASGKSLELSVQPHASLSRDTPNFLNVSYRHMAPTQRNPWKLHLAAESHHEYCVYISVINDFQPYSVQGTPIDPKTKKPEVGPDGKRVIVTTTIGVGTSIMAGNYIHGGINTKGCWPLFRNFNWPLVKQEQFLSIYLNDVRAGTGATEIAKKLESLRYDAPFIKGSKWSSSFEKFLIWDQNYAYTFLQVRSRYRLLFQGRRWAGRAKLVSDPWSLPGCYAVHQRGEIVQ